ncbi:MAG: acetyltransferase [Dysgonamonadaceae bacterium]|jgi:sugar O-acyltransferase (sialic acid O-acetyltransferase NeuD family)|nr:acetyltransferase [Dysgonamonadaceae bacterium]
MKNLIIIGAGGMGREVYNLAVQCDGYKNDYIIKGFLDDNIHSLDGLGDYYPPVLSSVENYTIEKNDFFVCSIGNVLIKKKCTEIIKNKGGNFISLVHPTALINPTAKIGSGCLVFPYAQIGSLATVGNFALIQSFSGIGHDVSIGDYARIDIYVLCIGGVKIGNCVTIHTGAILNHRTVVEDYATIGATSFVIRRVKEGVTVFGNPARPI